MLNALTLVAIALAVAMPVAAQAAAQKPSPPARPYAQVAIALPAASDDRSLAEFRAALAAAARSRIYAELERLVQAQDFFWDRDFGQRFDPRRPAVDNLAAALQLERRGGRGWEALAAFAAESRTEPMASRPGVICAPARPSFDSVAFARLLDDTNTNPQHWAYPAAVATVVYAAPETGAAATGAVGGYFVRLLGFVGPNDEPAPARTQWARIALPDGRIGFVAPDSLRSLEAERLCYIKDLVGGWRIAGLVAGGS